MPVLDTVTSFRAARKTMMGRVGVVPTMGALHAGHLSLVEASLQENDYTIVTIFVNPLQFGASEDFTRYPRDLAGDIALLEEVGFDVNADLVFAPVPADMYPDGFETTIKIGGVTRGLEGERRPGHFDGVATVVAKLFNLTQPSVAYFGQKDAQQVAVIKKLMRDLDYSHRIAICPTVREESGLAMSSRNRYLSAEEREKAATLYSGLQSAADAYAQGTRRAGLLTDAAIRAFAPDVQVEYVSVNDAVSLMPIQDAGEQPLLISLAVRVGHTRLIDNCLLPLPLNNREELTRILGGLA